MPEPIDIVRKHIEAVTRHDWDSAKISLSPHVDLSLEGVVDWEWQVTALYRSITQAWDFTVTETRLTDEGMGVVNGALVLVNGDWRKEVVCEYRVVVDRIVSIAFSSSPPTNASTALQTD